MVEYLHFVENDKCVYDVYVCNISFFLLLRVVPKILHILMFLNIPLCVTIFNLHKHFNYS